MDLPKPGLGSHRNPQNSTLNQSIINSKNLFPHNFGSMLSAGWMLLVLFFFFGHFQMYWVMMCMMLERGETCERWKWTEYLEILHAGLGLCWKAPSTPFPPLSPVWQRREWQTLSPDRQPSTRSPPGSHSRAGRGVLLASGVIWGRQYNSTRQRSPFHAPAVSWLGGPSYVAVMFPLVRRAASVVRAHRSD